MCCTRPKPPAAFTSTDHTAITSPSPAHVSITCCAWTVTKPEASTREEACWAFLPYTRLKYTGDPFSVLRTADLQPLARLFPISEPPFHTWSPPRSRFRCPFNAVPTRIDSLFRRRISCILLSSCTAPNMASHMPLQLQLYMPTCPSTPLHDTSHTSIQPHANLRCGSQNLLLPNQLHLCSWLITSCCA